MVCELTAAFIILEISIIYQHDITLVWTIHFYNIASIEILTFMDKIHVYLHLTLSRIIAEFPRLRSSLIDALFITQQF